MHGKVMWLCRSYAIFFILKQVSKNFPATYLLVRIFVATSYMELTHKVLDIHNMSHPSTLAKNIFRQE